ncbi:uncharacterized protein sytl2a isoform X2 [Conger conger]|uniref:uncharacterized protein sytl2a isoform X2 n=1 Tax=Conger conger TaxID=82655 RepID=UPI002A5AD3C5|nr:uncharacterized protein sytl2a isoform X2 [Conger conger]
MIQGRGLSSRPAEQSHGLAEEQGCPIAKVLEGFSWGCDGSNQYDAHQKGAQEAVEEFGILEDAALDDKPSLFSGTNSVKAESQKPGREPSEKKVKSPARSDTEAQTLYGNVSHTEQMTDGPTLRKYPVFHYLNTEASSQRESCITASENKLRPGTEGKLMSQREAEDKTAPLSHPVVGDAQLAMKRKYVYEEISPQRLANLKLFWEKGICGSKILISKTSKYSETNKTMKEFVDRSEADQKWSKSGVDLCKVGRELPFWTGETSPAPETMKNVYGHYNLHFKARNESEPHDHEVGVKRSPLDSANSITITEQSGHSLFHKEAYPNPEKDSSHLEDSSTYFESRNILTNQNEEDIYVAKPIISEEVPEGLKTNIQTGHQGQEFGSKHDSLAACGQTDKQQDDRAGKISHLKSKGKSGPKIIVGKQKGSLETKVNQIPEPTSSCAEKELAISRSDLRSVGIELDRSSLPSIKEQPETELENQTANNAQYGHIDDCRGTVPSVKAELLSTDGVPQHSKSTYQETLVMQQACQFLVGEPSPDCPPQIPPRCPIKSKTETCSSKSHSVDVCPPIRELIEKEQKQIPPIWQKKVHSPRRIAWDSGVTKIAIETKDVHHPSTQPQEASEQPRNRRGSEGHGTDCTPDSPRSNIPKTWSNSLASSDCCDESQSPVKALKQISARPVAESKNLEDISSQQTISPVSTCPSSSFSEREQMKKRCASMPAFLHGEASSSLMSIYSLEFENVEVKGTIQFALSYVQKLGELHVFVVRCRDLAIADSKKNRSDPYVKSYLLPDKARLGKKKTTVKKKTINPIYNEILRYKIDVETLKSQVLNLSVWHHNSFGRNSFLGEVDFELSKWDLRNTHMNDFRLKSKSTSGLEPTDDRGEIRLALRFLQQSSHGKRTPKTGLVQIFVKECKNLPLIRGAAIDPFVKCYVLPDTNRKSRQKSRVLRRTANPVFNHTMVYDGFKAEDLQEACVEITVWDHDRLNNHFLGGVRLSLGTGRSHGTVVDWMDSNTAEAMLWEQMMDSHNEWVEDVLPLRMLMMAHSMSK